ncbi:hypothetical protein J6590_002885 [Homalodisca vitripennis]|nr:hypothetical protein J6590_002885 [Homalodisca vitripennis]
MCVREFHGVFSGLKEIIKREKFFALYKGNGAQMVRIFPYAATQFTTFELYKKWSAVLLGPNSHIGKFLAGSSAGVTAVLFTYPLDTIRARLAFQVAGEHVYTGIIHTGLCMYQQEGGFRALYRGFVPTICGMIPYAGFSFYCFEMMKYCCMKYVPQYTCSPCSRNTGGLVLSLPAKLLCGGLAGAVAQSFSYPMDVTRRRMQLAMMSPETQKFACVKAHVETSYIVVQPYVETSYIVVQVCNSPMWRHHILWFRCVKAHVETSYIVVQPYVETSYIVVQVCNSPTWRHHILWFRCVTAPRGDPHVETSYIMVQVCNSPTWRRHILWFRCVTAPRGDII